MISDYKYTLNIMKKELNNKFICPEVRYAFETSIKVLEKEILKSEECNKCELCEGKNSIIHKNANHEWCVEIENSHWNNYNDCMDYKELEIDFCPWCGRELEI